MQRKACTARKARWRFGEIKTSCGALLDAIVVRVAEDVRMGRRVRLVDAGAEVIAQRPAQLVARRAGRWRRPTRQRRLTKPFGHVQSEGGDGEGAVAVAVVATRDPGLRHN